MLSSGGVLCVTYSVAVGTGVSYFQYTDIDSGRNIFIVGFTMFMGLMVPKWLFGAPGSLTTGTGWGWSEVRISACSEL